jgi:hypothetical protein
VPNVGQMAQVEAFGGAGVVLAATIVHGRSAGHR